MTSWEEDRLAAEELHLALMGGWCRHHPNRPPGGVFYQ